MSSTEPMRWSGNHQSPDDHQVRENNHEQPNKRLRTQSSPITGSSKSSAIHLDDSQDMLLSDQSFPFSEKIPAPTFDSSSPRKGGLTRTPGLVVNVPPPEKQPHHLPTGGLPTDSHAQHYQPSYIRASGSPDELLDDEFIKRARRQRLQRPLNDDLESLPANVGSKTKTQFDEMLQSSPPPRKTRARRNSSNFAVQQRQSSRMDKRLQLVGESSDEIQGDCTTVVNGHERASSAQKSVTPPAETHSTSSKIKARNATPNHKDSTSFNEKGKHVFPLEHYIYYNVPQGKNMLLVIDKNSKELSLEFAHPTLDQGAVLTLLVRSILRMTLYPQDSRPRIVLSTNHSDAARRLCFEFSTHDDSVQFYKVINDLGPGIRLLRISETKMDGIFLHSVSYMAEIAAQEKQRTAHRESHLMSATSPTANARTSNYFPEGQTGVKKARLIDQLDDANGTTIISGAERSGSELKSEGYGKTRNSKVFSEESTIQNPHTRTRLLRNSSHKIRGQAPANDGLLTKTLVTPKKTSAFQKLKRWDKPLVYPPTGKKRETVQFEDLQRLDDDEFLNDNLVCLFLRYLEEHANPERLKKIHFFNSFLFEALTKDVKARRGINFDAVKRWTSKVDLFSRDFVVVPVNENLHWFVMIICNLSYFKEKNVVDLDGDEEDENSALQPVSPSVEDESVVILRSDLDETAEASTRTSFAEMTLEEADRVPCSQTTLKSSNGVRGRKKVRRSLPKYAVNKPVIITLDSLDIPRSSTASLLRQYIVAEARDKKGWNIDGNEIKGMTAKGIPHQNNYSDCGLYLCMYLEQFILDPYIFVRRLLQRDEQAGLPRHIESSDLRDRLRNLLLNLYEQQQAKGHSSSNVPPLGSILVNTNVLEQHEDPAFALADVQAAKRRWSEQQAKQDATRSVSPSNHNLDEGIPVINSLDDWKQLMNDPITVLDDDGQSQVVKSPPHGKSGDIKSPYFGSDHHDTEETVVTKLRKTQHQDPIELANQIRQARSPERTGEAGESYTGVTPDKSNAFLAGIQEYGTQSEVSIMTQSSLRKSQSPTKYTVRRNHHKFKKLEQGTKEVEIEESDFEGFEDPIEVPHAGNETLPEIRNKSKGVDGQRVRKRSASRVITGDGELTIVSRPGSSHEPEMLL